MVLPKERMGKNQFRTLEDRQDNPQRATKLGRADDDTAQYRQRLNYHDEAGYHNDNNRVESAEINIDTDKEQRPKANKTEISHDDVNQAITEMDKLKPNLLQKGMNIIKPNKDTKKRGYDVPQVFQFEAHDAKASISTQAYYPQHEDSGVTIGGGVDLGQIEKNEFERIANKSGMSKEQKDFYRQFLGLKGDKAKAKLEELNPLPLDKQTALKLTIAKYDEIEKGLKRNYDEFIEKKDSKNGRSYDELSREEKTVLMSLAMNHGENADMPKTITHLYHGNQQGVIDELNNYYEDNDKPPLKGNINRRKREAEYLQKYYNSLNHEHDNQSHKY